MYCSRRGFLRLGSTGLLVTGLASRASGLDQLLAKRLPLKIGATDWNLDQEGKVGAVAMAKKIGFDGVEVSLGVGTDKLPMSNPDLQKEYLEASRKSNLPIESTCLEILHRNALKSDPLAKRWVADSIPITRALGARVILLPFFGKAALKTQQEMDYVCDYLKEIAPEAEKSKVILGLENTISAEDNARILDRVHSRAIGVYYDIGNSTHGKFDILKEIRWLGKDRICHFHLKDNPYFLGKGSINVPAVIDAIAEIGYTGWAMLETDSPSKNIEADMTTNLNYVRSLIG
ncbi:MAG TPA: sugar phosphate isomerase/epimerase family protein [Terriglobia bacterium]|nr:sugar phosphate isomerase/epimerase family protein [Terriglobia bacterium]